MSQQKKISADEITRKIRELKKIPGNECCFDCGERSPTYVNMTLGTFVCNTCSGLQRAYNFRLKSISMSSFSFEDLEFLRKHGNQVAKQKWLFHLGPNVQKPSNKEIRKLKEFMDTVYVDKKWVRMAKEVSSEDETSEDQESSEEEVKPSKPPKAKKSVKKTTSKNARRVSKPTKSTTSKKLDSEPKRKSVGKGIPQADLIDFSSGISDSLPPSQSKPSLNQSSDLLDFGFMSISEKQESNSSDVPDDLFSSSLKSVEPTGASSASHPSQHPTSDPFSQVNYQIPSQNMAYPYPNQFLHYNPAYAHAQYAAYVHSMASAHAAASFHHTGHANATNLNPNPYFTHPYSRVDARIPPQANFVYSNLNGHPVSSGVYPYGMTPGPSPVAQNSITEPPPPSLTNAASAQKHMDMNSSHIMPSNTSDVHTDHFNFLSSSIDAALGKNSSVTSDAYTPMSVASSSADMLHESPNVDISFHNTHDINSENPAITFLSQSNGVNSVDGLGTKLPSLSGSKFSESNSVNIDLFRREESSKNHQSDPDVYNEVKKEDNFRMGNATTSFGFSDENDPFDNLIHDSSTKPVDLYSSYGMGSQNISNEDVTREPHEFNSTLTQQSQFSKEESSYPSVIDSSISEPQPQKEKSFSFNIDHSISSIAPAQNRDNETSSSKSQITTQQVMHDLQFPVHLEENMKSYELTNQPFGESKPSANSEVPFSTSFFPVVSESKSKPYPSPAFNMVGDAAIMNTSFQKSALASRLNLTPESKPIHQIPDFGESSDLLFDADHNPFSIDQNQEDDPFYDSPNPF